MNGRIRIVDGIRCKVRSISRDRYIPTVEFEWARKAAGLPGKALAVGLYLYYRSKLEKSPTVTLSFKSLHLRFNVDRRVARAGLSALEKVGLVKVTHRPRKSAIVTLLPAPKEDGL